MTDNRQIHKPPDPRHRRLGTWVALTALVLAAVLGPAGWAGANAHPGLIFGPPDPANGGLPAWISSPGAQPCSLTLVDDHGPYYALEAIGTAGGLRFKYIAGVEGFPTGDPEINPDPFVSNAVLVRVEGLPAGTYTVQEPTGTITSVSSSGGRVVVEESNVDPQTGPVVDLTITSGNFRLLRGTEVLIDAPVDHTCAPFQGDPNNAPPIPSFTVACVQQTCNFDASATTDSDGTVVSYGWNFGDGTPTGSGVTVSHTYTGGGAKTIVLSVTDNGGATRTATRSVTLNHPPTALFAVFCSGRTCNFDAGVSSDRDGTIVSYAWTFGDGSTGTGVSASRTYAANGLFTVTLVVTDNQGATGTVSRVVNATAATLPPSSIVFRPHDGNNWWVQTRVSGGPTPTAVCATVNGAAPCRPLSLRSWGSWANSFFVPTGAHVTFTATFASGATATSGAFVWPSGTPVSGGGGTTPPPPPPPTGSLTATFRTGAHNQWWVEVYVTANQPLSKVEAQVNGGAWVLLEKKAWGSYAKSFFVPNGGVVKFRATSTSGATALSGGYVWPSATRV